ncbi:ATP-binding protein [Maledivibacter halophilus]|uniref:histidine kinase n=1 Tax=Maledivibacter halophilus TaxID=36842 RepID=A0A1T5IRG6_9FIRM|nr:sensor histidine kinase [Maledivibacter halophilus]SKC41749.1 two-component system, CitB family, sensor kinase [Maledivibacter halophilus]
MKLQYKITLFMTIILIVLIGGIGFLTYQQVQDTVETQMGNNAMDLAVTVASIDIIQETLGTTKDYRVIQDTVEDLREKTRFQYIIVMDMEGIKYSYPYENGLGKKYRSGGEKRVLEKGQSYVSADRNVLISAIRAFVPIYYNDRQVGAVLVGLLTDTVYKEISAYLFNFRVTVISGLIIGIIGAWALSHTIKKTIFGLEPREIALLLGERDLVLHSLRNGILSINQEGKITFFNKAAREVFGFEDKDKGRNISEFNFTYTNQIMNVLKTGKAIYNQEMKICPDKTLLCSHKLLKNHKAEVIGVVSSFQDLTEVKQMAEELTGIKKMTNALRAQNHEFMNKLHTISGLMQLGEYDKAVDYISYISQQRNEILGVLSKKIKSDHISGLLLAKYNKAMESRIDLEIDPSSSLEEIPKSITEDEICSIIGNLIENAIDELIKNEDGKIVVRLNSDNEGLNIWVKDNGPGISREIRERIFDRGTTTKPGNRGLGLSIVKEIVDCAGGRIKLIQDNGTIWDIFIPKEGEKSYD